jgi:hypothetical protein
MLKAMPLAIMAMAEIRMMLMVMMMMMMMMMMVVTMMMMMIKMPILRNNRNITTYDCYYSSHHDYEWPSNLKLSK